MYQAHQSIHQALRSDSDQAVQEQSYGIEKSAGQPPTCLKHFLNLLNQFKRS